MTKASCPTPEKRDTYLFGLVQPAFLDEVHQHARRLQLPRNHARRLEHIATDYFQQLTEARSDVYAASRVVNQVYQQIGQLNDAIGHVVWDPENFLLTPGDIELGVLREAERTYRRVVDDSSPTTPAGRRAFRRYIQHFNIVSTASIDSAPRDVVIAAHDLSALRRREFDENKHKASYAFFDDIVAGSAFYQSKDLPGIRAFIRQLRNGAGDIERMADILSRHLQVEKYGNSREFYVDLFCTDKRPTALSYPSAEADFIAARFVVLARENRETGRH